MELDKFIDNYVKAEAFAREQEEADKKKSEILLHNKECEKIKKICTENEILNIVGDKIYFHFSYVKIASKAWYTLFLPECAPIDMMFNGDGSFSKDYMLSVHDGDIESDLKYYQSWNFQKVVYNANKTWSSLADQQKYRIVKNMLEFWKFVDQRKCLAWFWNIQD